MEASTPIRPDRPDAEAALLAVLWHRRPRVVVKADLLPAISVLSFVSLAGIPAGWIWAMIVPPTRMLITASQGPLPLPDEELHAFDAVALHAVLGLAIGALLGAAVWLLRERRGPVIMIAAVLGALVAGWLTLTIGSAFANGFYPPPGSAKAGQFVLRAPESGGILPIVSWGLGSSLAYGVLAVWNGMHDLGRRLS